ncbi:MAG: hypothetical protein SPG64_05390, partial [Candidatus Enteromonas sp.]|nr:hypothetical protein [Candidatus Enteromonas sp.]
FGPGGRIPFWWKLADFKVLRVRENGLERLPPDVLEGVLEVAVRVEPVDYGRPDDREKPDGVPGAGLAAITPSSCERREFKSMSFTELLLLGKMFR